MKRFLMMLQNEFKLFRTTIPIHIVGIFQPALMFSMMALVLVTPTFQMKVMKPSSDDLVAAMRAVRSPIGVAYIEPLLVDAEEGVHSFGGQIVTVVEIDGVPTAVQHFGLVDSNIVKNFRNRLTNAALLLWNETLDGRAVEIVQYPLLPHDTPYCVYFGMAMLPLAAFMAAAMIGAFLTAQEFEFKTIMEYRLAPAAMVLVVGARLLRLSLTGTLSALVLMLFVGLTGGVWPASIVAAGLIFLGMGMLGGCLGTMAGLLLQRSLPAFVVCLALSFFTWIMGSGFGLASGFGGLFEALSRWIPNTYAVELLFPLYYRLPLGDSRPAILALGVFNVGLVLITIVIYHLKVIRPQGQKE